MSRKETLSKEETKSFGLRYVYSQLVNDGFEVLSVRPEPDVDPQMVAKKEEQLYFFVIRTEIYPEVGDLPSISIIKQIQEHARKHEAKAKFISLGIMNAGAKAESEKSMLYKGGEFYVNYSGIKELVRLTGDQL
jgi:hypothetical protein